MSRGLVRVGVDTGGTFTDLVAVEAGRVRIAKVLSTPDNPARAVLTGLASLGIEHRPLALTYSTTVATNALLERRGARLLLFTTAGFEDVLEIGRQARPELYALEPTRPAPLVKQRDRIGVPERSTYDGRILQPLTEAAIGRAVALARRRRPEATAVCFLHSYRRPGHERRLARALRAAGFPCTASHELGARPREYERFSTASINAYVAPRMSAHLAQLAAHVRDGVFRVMQSNGGAMSASTAAREPARTILSGPAAGVVGAAAMARRAGLARVITFDMGGTSTDVCLVDGAIRRHADCAVGGLPINLPAIDVHTVGAGGGSIAFRDAGGGLKVGPRSAGADPGPACYGRGEEPTVTDANLLLGRLGEGVLAGGFELQRPRAERAVRRLARTLGLTLDEAALGIVQIANASMESAIRAVSVERGHDPQDYTLLAFGGAAGLHACELAQSLGMRSVLVPCFPGVLSAWGAAGADVVREYVETVRVASTARAALRAVAARLARRARVDMLRERVGVRGLRLEAFLGARYAGQSFEIDVALRGDWVKAFHAAHLRLFGHADAQRPVEVVYVGLRASAPQGTALLRRRDEERAPEAARVARVRTTRGWARARTLARGSLSSGDEVRGPAVVAEHSATTYVPPGWTAAVDRHGNLLISHASPTR